MRVKPIKKRVLARLCEQGSRMSAGGIHLLDDDAQEHGIRPRWFQVTAIGPDQDEVEVDDYLVVECYRIIDPDTYTDVYNDYFLKRYATALIKRQWGQNLLKFEGMVMPGGVTFNGRQLYDDANEEITRL